MTAYILKLKKGDLKGYSSAEILIGQKSRIIGTSEGELLLFSSKERAENYAKSIGILNQVDISTPYRNIGYLLETAASVDHFSAALLDERDIIFFFSCLAGYFLLPSHFYRLEKNGFEALWNDDEWHRQDIDMEYPTCVCGDMLGAYFPFSLKFEKKRAIPGLWQVIAGSYTRFDGTGCNSLVVLDMEPPRESFMMEVLLTADRHEVPIHYAVTPRGFSRIEQSHASRKIEPWQVCPITGLVRIGITNITSKLGLDSCELFLCEDNSDLSTTKRVDSTGKAVSLPIIEYESIPESAQYRLDQLSKSR